MDWVKNLKYRVDFIRDALAKMNDVKSYDMNAFFNPKKFLNVLTIAMLSKYQEEAAKTLDQVELVFEVKDKLFSELEQLPQVGGFNVHGFWLEGANFERENNQISELAPRAEGVEFPVINIQCNEKSDDKRRVGNKKHTSLI